MRPCRRDAYSILSPQLGLPPILHLQHPFRCLESARQPRGAAAGPQGGLQDGSTTPLGDIHALYPVHEPLVL